jgi:D-alanyl-D-alanine dipeptidase
MVEPLKPGRRGPEDGAGNSLWKPFGATHVWLWLAMTAVASWAPLRAQVADTGAPVTAPDSVARRLLVDVRSLDSTIVAEARYAGTNNFTGAVLPGYTASRVYLRREAAEALARVQRRLRSGGMGLKVFDGYRPVRATRAMVEWARRTGRMRLIEDGYIASRSRHNLGLAVDLTLLDWSVGGREVDMGTPYDTFSEEAHFGNATGRTLRYRQLLRHAMESEGFRQYEQEWWHYSFEVPGETPAFDVEVR